MAHGLHACFPPHVCWVEERARTKGETDEKVYEPRGGRRGKAQTTRGWLMHALARRRRGEGCGVGRGW